MNKDFFQRVTEREQAEVPINRQLQKQLSERLGIERSPSWFKRLWGSVAFAAKPIGAFAIVGVLVFVVSSRWEQGGSLVQVFSLHQGTDDWVYDTNQRESEQLKSQTASTGLTGSVAVSASLPTNQMSPFAAAGNFLRAAGQPAGLVTQMAPTAASLPMEAMSDNALGYAVGGAKDIANFRENLKQGYLPLSSDITTEGLFYDYSFDTGLRQPCNELFCPSYARAITRNPLTNQNETYLSVGLNSNLKASDFTRPKTNFVVILDISGSMDSPFDQYYYDGRGVRHDLDAAEAKKTKIQIANESVAALVDHLNADDRLGIVVFSDDATIAKPLNVVSETDRAVLKRHIMTLKATNGTNMSAGLEKGFSLLKDQTIQAGYNNRLIFITDAMPNVGEFGAAGLEGLAQRYADAGVQTTFVGVGVDFQTQLTEALTKVRGANYVSVHSAQDFKQHLADDFDYLVTPLVYDLRLSVKGSGYAIDKIYGSPDADLSSGDVLHVRTLFPSKTSNGETKGGIVLLKLRETGEHPELTLQASYEDTRGQSHSNKTAVSFGGICSTPTLCISYENKGIEKAVLLSRYAELLKSWLGAEWGDRSLTAGGAQWERISRQLQVSDAYRSQFQHFAQFFKQETHAIGDPTLDQEQAILEMLSTWQWSVGPSTPINDPVPMLSTPDNWRM